MSWIFIGALSLRSVSTSRISACSLTWPRIAWSTSTTGASAHWPKQATVRIVKRRSGVVSVSLSAPSAVSWRPSWSFTRSSSAREPRVWQAVPRQMATVCVPCGSRLNSA